MVSTISRGSTVFIASDWTVIEVLVCGVHKGGGLERAIVLSVVDAYVPVCLPLEVERALERGHGKKTHCDSVFRSLPGVSLNSCPDIFGRG